MGKLLGILCFLLASLVVNAQDTAFFLGSQSNDVTSVAYSPDGEYIVTGSWDGHLFIYYNDSTPSYYLSFADHKNAITSLAFSRDGSKLLAAGIDGVIASYSFPDKDSLDYISLDTMYEFGTKPINKVIYGPGMRMIFSADDGGVLTSYDMKNKKLKTFKAEGPIKSFAVSIDRKHYYISTKGSADVVQYNITGKEIRRFEGHTGEVNDIEVTLDRKYMISGSSDKTVKIWNLTKGKLEISLSNHTWDITGLAVDQYSRYVASCGLDGMTYIYQIGNGQLLKTYKNTNGRCNDIAFSADITKLIVGLHMDNPGPSGYGCNIWSTGLERPRAKRSKVRISSSKKPKARRTISTNSSSSKGSKKPAKDKKVIEKTDQVEISIEE